METKKFNNVPMFRRADLSPYNNGQYGAIFEDRYDLEVKGGKGRVFSNNPFVKEPSSWCKLKLIKQLPNSNKSIFRLKVNGQYAFFKVALNLPKGHYFGK
jgi:hypothetical protein